MSKTDDNNNSNNNNMAGGVQRWLASVPDLGFDAAMRKITNVTTKPPGREDVRLYDQSVMMQFISFLRQNLPLIDGKISQKVPAHILQRLTEDHKLAIMAYSAGPPYDLYLLVNAVMMHCRDQDQPSAASSLQRMFTDHVGPYIRLLLRGLYILEPRTVKQAARAVRVRNHPRLMEQFHDSATVLAPGRPCSFFGFNSWTLSDKVMRDPAFSGGALEKAIIYKAVDMTCVDIAPFSVAPADEQEVMPIPPSFFEVQSSVEIPNVPKVVVMVRHVDNSAHLYLDDPNEAAHRPAAGGSGSSGGQHHHHQHQHQQQQQQQTPQQQQQQTQQNNNNNTSTTNNANNNASSPTGSDTSGMGSNQASDLSQVQSNELLKLFGFDDASNLASQQASQQAAAGLKAAKVEAKIPIIHNNPTSIQPAESYQPPAGQQSALPQQFPASQQQQQQQQQPASPPQPPLQQPQQAPPPPPPPQGPQASYTAPSPTHSTSSSGLGGAASPNQQQQQQQQQQPRTVLTVPATVPPCDNVPPHYVWQNLPEKTPCTRCHRMMSMSFLLVCKTCAGEIMMSKYFPHLRQLGPGAPVRFSGAKLEMFWELSNGYHVQLADPQSGGANKRYFSSVEAMFQAGKFAHAHPRIAEEIRLAPSAREAFDIGFRNQASVRGDWENIKIDAMRFMLFIKFRSSFHCNAVLKTTEQRQIIYETPYDPFWGSHGGSGQNMLGRLLMEVRQEIAREPPLPVPEDPVPCGGGGGGGGGGGAPLPAAPSSTASYTSNNSMGGQQQQQQQQYHAPAGKPCKNAPQGCPCDARADFEFCCKTCGGGHPCQTRYHVAN